jgi:uncharacterized protein YhfF
MARVTALAIAMVSQSVSEFWKAFINAARLPADSHYYDVSYFGDSQQLADGLAQLVLDGVKRATAGAVWAYEKEGKRLPAVGDFSIITNWAGAPLCVIETTGIDLTPLHLVSAEFAQTEGEGDRSLEYWRQCHRDFFTRECEAAGLRFNEDLLICCERFRVVFPPQ